MKCGGKVFVLPQYRKLLQECEPFSFVEIFAGQAEATHSSRSADYRSARLDIMYLEPQPGRQNPMDLNSDPGFVTLGEDLVGDDDVKLASMAKTIP